MKSLVRSITQVAIAQGAAGSTDLVAIPGAGLKIYVVAFKVVLDAAGTVKFTEGTGPTDLTGAMPLNLNGELNAFNDDGTPVLSTVTANSKLSIVTVTGKATGWLRYFIDA